MSKNQRCIRKKHCPNVNLMVQMERRVRWSEVNTGHLHMSAASHRSLNKLKCQYRFSHSEIIRVCLSESSLFYNSGHQQQVLNRLLDSSTHVAESHVIRASCGSGKLSRWYDRIICADPPEHCCRTFGLLRFLENNKPCLILHNHVVKSISAPITQKQ